MSNTGQTVSKQDDIQYHMFSDDNGDWVCHHFYLDVVKELEQRIADQLKLIKVAGDRISILEGDVKYMTQECEKAKNRNYDDYSTLRQLDELVNYRHIILTAKE